MRLTYLVKGEPGQDAHSLAGGGVSCEASQFGEPEQDLWALSYSTGGNAMDDARSLSAVSAGFDDLGVERLLLEDGASAYYERRLFQHVADFERKLRAALCVRVALLEGDLGSKLVEDLERIDFGTLFERFFVDDAFVKGYRGLVRKDGRRYEKADLLAAVGAIPESPVWDTLFEDGEAPTVRASHGFIRDVRNDVMHAHRMTADTFRKARATLVACNAELDGLLRDVPSEEVQPGAFGEALSNVLADRPPALTWEDVAEATWGDLARAARWADLTNAFERSASGPARGSAEDLAADMPDIARAIAIPPAGPDRHSGE